MFTWKTRTKNHKHTQKYFYRNQKKHIYTSQKWWLKILTILNTPEATHTRRLALTEPVYFSTPVGDTKMPLPMMEPTMTVMPFIRDILASNAPSSPLASGSDSGSDFKASVSHSSLLFGDLERLEKDLNGGSINVTFLYRFWSKKMFLNNLLTSVSKWCWSVVLSTILLCFAFFHL